MKINLGCGDRYVDGWLNVDLPEMPHRADARVDITGPLPDEWLAQASHVYAGHVLEHIDAAAVEPLLTRLRACMDPSGGLIMMIGPDVDAARKLIEAGTFDPTYHSLESIRDGGHRWHGDEHRWECSPAEIVGMARRAGWNPVTDVGLGGVSAFWPVADRTQPWQFAVRAYVRSDPDAPPW